MGNSVRAVVTLFLLALNSMAQTLPRPTGLYFEPLLEGQSGMLQDDSGKIIPQIANHGSPQSGGFFMIFQAINVSAATATFQAEFFDANGEAMNLPLATSSDDLIGTPAHGFQGTLSPEGSGAQVTIPDGSPTAIGYAVVKMDPAESVVLTATFVQFVPGRPPFMAGVPLSSVLHKTAFMPFLAEGGFTPALALVSLRSQDVTLIAYSGLGGDELCRATMNFGDGHHRAFLLRDVLPCASMSEGTLEIRGDSQLPASIAGIGFEGHEGGALVNRLIWTSREGVTGERFAPPNEPWFNGVVTGKRVVAIGQPFYTDFDSPGRFRESECGEIYPGSHAYENTGLTTGTLTADYDDGDRCTFSLTFDSTTTGSSAYECNDGSSGEYDWRLVGMPSEAGDAYTPLEGGTGNDLFHNYISGPIVQAKCINCHVEGGRSGHTRLVFQPTSAPDHGAHNLATIEHFLATVDGGANRILNKVQGMRHGGGVQVPAGSADFDNMERLLGLLGYIEGKRCSGTR